MSTMPAAPRTADDEMVSAEAIGSVLVSGRRPRRPSALSAAVTFGWRGMLKIKHVPEQLLDVTVTPVLFLVMFTYLFGGALAGSTGEYLEYLLPGMLVQSVLFTCVYSGVALNTDVTKGVVDRFRSLPISRPAPLLGAVLGDMVRFTIAAVVVVALGFIMGFSAGEGLLGVLGGMLLVLVFAFGLSWAFTSLGLVMRSPSAVMNGGFMLLFPLIFVSDIFVDPSTLPSWLQTVVDVNPITHLANATRELMHGGASLGDIALPLAEAAVLTAIFAPLTVRLYRRAG